MNLERLALYSVLATAVAGLGYAGLLTREVLAKDQGTPLMQKISLAIREGANAYLKRQFKTIIFLIVLLAFGLYLTATEPWIATGRSLAFLAGALFSGLVGYLGMNMAVRGNVRVAAAANRHQFGEALKIGYRTGTITGMLTDGLGLLGGTTIFLIYGERAYEILLGFGFGACLLALFMRVGGGIYTKAADVGADLVGKVEKDIPEDDPRNAATIADNVGDNVGDCAGMAADIFESYEVTIVSAMILGWAAFGHLGVVFPLLVRAIGVLSSIIGTYAVRVRHEKEDAMRAINRGFTLSAIISITGFLALAKFYFHDMRVGFATLAGVILAVFISRLTEYFTHLKYKPVQEIAQATNSGAATAILAGLASGFESTVYAIWVIAAAILASVAIFGGNPILAAYGVALCGIGMLTLTGNNISMDTFGPVVDNANGIGEMAHLDEKARKIMADLDSVGNITKAITKGIAIGSAVIAAVSLFRSFIESTNLTTISIINPTVFIGLLIGGSLPFLFSSMTIRAVSRAATLIVNEVRRQFREIKGLMEGKAEAEYGRVVDICTAAAIKEVVGPGLLAVLAPILVGFLLHEEALGGFLAGIILSGQLLAVFMANAGGAWDNAKKMIEDGIYGGKGSEAHKASVIGDTVGDPLKDTAGPALNPLIKVMNLVALLVAPLIIKYPHLNFPMATLLGLGLILVAWSIARSKKSVKIYF
jgi:K(+)-stimulated pyrophosphate-energized sodium pump